MDDLFNKIKEYEFFYSELFNTEIGLTGKERISENSIK